MIKRLAALALAGSVILGAGASSAVAGATPQPWNSASNDRLLQAVEDAGYTIYNGGGPCDTAPAYGLVAPSQNAFIICVENHQGNLQVLADTVRHEAVHVAQFCKARRVGATNALLMPDHNDLFTGLATDVLEAPFHMYPPSVRPYEAEAFAVAHVSSDDQVVRILEQECGV